MTTDGTPKDDVRVPDGDLGKQIEEAFEAGQDLIVSIVGAMGEEGSYLLIAQSRTPNSTEKQHACPSKRLPRALKFLSSGTCSLTLALPRSSVVVFSFLPLHVCF